MANDYFISVSDGLSCLEPLEVAQDFQVPDRYIISVEDVRAALHKVNLTKSIGPDYLPNWVLKDFADSLSQPLASVFNASLCQSTVPTIWKSADIVPLPKTRPPCIVEKDLCPISLTPVVAKILEGFVCGWLEKFSPDHEDSFQFGCVKGTCTTHGLIELNHSWAVANDTPKCYVRVMFLDFSRAFDHVEHDILLNKWSTTDIPQFLLRWKHSFLCQHQQRVRINSHVSEWKSPAEGTP